MRFVKHSHTKGIHHFEKFNQNTNIQHRFKFYNHIMLISNSNKRTDYTHKWKRIEPFSSSIFINFFCTCAIKQLRGNFIVESYEQKWKSHMKKNTTEPYSASGFSGSRRYISIKDELQKSQTCGTRAHIKNTANSIKLTNYRVYALLFI